MAIVNGVRPTLDDLATESEVYDSDSSDESDNFPKPTELQQIFHDIEHIITCLYKISVTVRNPTPHDRYIKVHEIDTSFFEPYDIQHVKGRYPKAPEYLAVRIGKAISRRRQYFKYRELHGAKIAQNLDAENTETTLSETTASGYNKKPTSQRSETASISGMTETSYATSAGSLRGNSARMPSMPKAAANGQYFECPYCYMIDSVKDTHAWRKHIYMDLEPYICTFDGCLIGSETYDSRRKWFDHEVQMHRSSWTCTIHCQRTFLSGDEFIAYLRQAYPGEVTSDQAPGLLKMHAKKVAKDSQTTCPLCSVSVSGLTRIRKHLAHHLEGLALFALPNDSYEDELHEGSTSISGCSEVNQHSLVSKSELVQLQDDVHFDKVESINGTSGLGEELQGSPLNTSEEDDKFERLEKLLMDQKAEQEAKAAAKEAAAIKAAADKAAQDLIYKKIADDLAAARAAATTEAEVGCGERGEEGQRSRSRRKSY